MDCPSWPGVPAAWRRARYCVSKTVIDSAGSVMPWAKDVAGAVPVTMLELAERHVAFSLGGPFAVEVWQAIPGTPLDMPEGGGVHHIGYWVDDLAVEAKRLDALGFPAYATAGTTPLLNRGPAGTLVRQALADATPEQTADWRGRHPAAGS